MSKVKPYRELRVLPDAAICRAEELTGNFGKCLVRQPFECPYAMPFGYVHLCGHPDRDAIIAHTIELEGGTKAIE